MNKKYIIMLIVLLAGMLVSNVLSWIVVRGKAGRDDVRRYELQVQRMRDSLAREMKEVDDGWRQWGHDVERWKMSMDSAVGRLEVSRGRVKTLEEWFKRGGGR